MIKFAILGIVQGLTEFLPVSSSGHLVILQHAMGIKGEEIAITVVMHLGTFFAVAAFFFKDILKLFKDFKTILMILLTTIITSCIGLLGKDFFESLFSSPRLVAFSFIATGLILLATKRLQAKKSDINFKDAAILGFTQAIAIIPGISRSGITISTLLFRKIDKESCFRFSFLVSLPVILGAAVLESRRIDFALQKDLNNLLIGFVFSLLSGLVSLWILKLVIIRSKFYYFAYYCFAIAVITLLFIR